LRLNRLNRVVHVTDPNGVSDRLPISTLVPGVSPTVPETVPVTAQVTETEPVTGTGLAGVLTTLTFAPASGPAPAARLVMPSVLSTASAINARRVSAR
jgi:hypothetical protein